MKSASRCVCTQSSTFPLCDGSHKGRDWDCYTAESSPLLIASSPALRNFAERLAQRLNGMAAHKTSQHTSDRILRLCDHSTPRPMPHLQGHRMLSIAVDLAESLVQPLLASDERLISVEDQDAPELWRTLLKIARADEAWSPIYNPSQRQESLSPHPYRHIFLSHAIADEGSLLSAVQVLRTHYRCEVFMCGDSLRSGSDWRAQLHDELMRTDLLLLTLSKDLLNSTYCAFEVGVAFGMNKELRVVSLDGSPPPTYLSHLHVLSIPQRAHLKPWFNEEELLLSALIEAMS